MDVGASKMDEEWAARPDVVMEYCIRDAELPLDILEELQAIRRKEATAAVAKVNFDTAANGSSSQLVDSQSLDSPIEKRSQFPLPVQPSRKKAKSPEAMFTMLMLAFIHGLQYLISRVCTLRL